MGLLILLLLCNDKKYIYFFFYYLIIINHSLANLNNTILLKIDNHIITSYELKNKIMSTLILSNTDINQQNIDRIKKQSLEALINNKIKFLETSKFKVETNINELNNYLNSISKNNLDQLKFKFEEYDLDFSLFAEEIETQLKWQKFIFNKYSKKISLDDRLINEEVQTLAKNMEIIEEFNLSEIEILRNDNETDNELISNIFNKIDLIGFEKAALSNSISNTSNENGNLGWVNSRSLNDQVFKNLSKLKIGEISKPIIRENSILILKLNDKRKSNINSINLVKLKQDLINKKNDLFNLYSNSHLSKLKNSSFIEYNK